MSLIINMFRILKRARFFGFWDLDIGFSTLERSNAGICPEWKRVFCRPWGSSCYVDGKGNASRISEYGMGAELRPGHAKITLLHRTPVPSREPDKGRRPVGFGEQA